ncbi:hypothetical protein ACH5RR_040653 [Cinchona calisaya]|uniref:Uncharacterized protein n=1 Tax=Cinchona calisaya TaxID=153742 RepID=A0ABD2XU06_9GENT
MLQQKQNQFKKLEMRSIVASGGHSEYIPITSLDAASTRSLTLSNSLIRCQIRYSPPTIVELFRYSYLLQMVVNLHTYPFHEFASVDSFFGMLNFVNWCKEFGSLINMTSKNCGQI